MAVTGMVLLFAVAMAGAHFQQRNALVYSHLALCQLLFGCGKLCLARFNFPLPVRQLLLRVCKLLGSGLLGIVILLPAVGQLLFAVCDLRCGIAVERVVALCCPLVTCSSAAPP